MSAGKGLVYSRKGMGNDTSWIFDSYSTEAFGSSWGDFGYEIVLRPEEIRAPDSVVEELKEALMKSFGLSPEHYRFEPTFWRIYWDKGPLRASMLKKCEKALNKVAVKYDITFMVNGLIIQPRPMGYIKKHIEWNE